MVCSNSHLILGSRAMQLYLIGIWPYLVAFSWLGRFFPTALLAFALGHALAFGAVVSLQVLLHPYLPWSRAAKYIAAAVVGGFVAVSTLITTMPLWVWLLQIAVVLGFLLWLNFASISLLLISCTPEHLQQPSATASPSPVITTAPSVNPRIEIDRDSVQEVRIDIASLGVYSHHTQRSARRGIAVHSSPSTQQPTLFG